ncbi:MAG TPA: oxygen-independent coproporphyrinogen III oxidase [Sphingomicrobium sp.]|nr:oxygen-independent coproporphyrinogen III oxidase [Sphingomicrobium sp.]
MISPDIFAKYAAMRVPRYTSYPTAPHFSAAVDETRYRSWLRALPDGEPVSIYLHIPFCREMCWYCGCHTTVTRRRAPVSRNAATLAREIDLVGTAVGRKLDAGHLHWGGGSPTLLAPDDVAAVHGALKKWFPIESEAERAVEIDPRTLTIELATAFARAGVNRASLGVQTFDPEVQAAINRVQSFETTAETVRTLRDRGIPAINFDLVYGLPFQTVQSCLDTVEQALRLQPDRFAVFGYAHVPEFKRHQRKIDERALPGPSERHEQAEAIARALTLRGYRQIGLDHFALPGDSLAIAAETGRLHRNFQGYTTDPCKTLLGFGVSAIGRLPGGFVQNATRIPDYERRIAAGSLATVRGYELDPEDRRRASIIEQLMCDYRADVSGIDAPLDQLETEGLIRRRGGIVEVVEDARPLVRAVAAAFDAKLPGSGARHVTAV